MTQLSVNINKIALLRNARGGSVPNPVHYVDIIARAGGHGVTIHPRSDQRHIHADDVHLLHQHITTHNRQHPLLELNIEGNPFAQSCASTKNGVSDYPGFLSLIRAAPPHQCTLVPDTPHQLTSDHGFDLTQDCAALVEVIAEIHRIGSRVSLFLDADIKQVERAAEIGAERIELYTGPYATIAAHNQPVDAMLQHYQHIARRAQECNLGLNAGHDLNCSNLSPIIQLPGLLEVSIGQALITDALEYGLFEAIKKYLAIIENAPR